MLQTFKNWRVWHLSVEQWIPRRLIGSNHSFRLSSCHQTFYSESIADLIEDSDGWWRSLSSFKPCKTWEDCPVDITFEQVTVFFAKNFTRCRILMSLVELCKFRTLSTPVYGKHRHSYRKFWRLRSPSQYPTTLVAILRGQRAVYLDYTIDYLFTRLNYVTESPVTVYFSVCCYHRLHWIKPCCLFLKYLYRFEWCKLSELKYEITESKFLTKSFPL